MSYNMLPVEYKPKQPFYLAYALLAIYVLILAFIVLHTFELKMKDAENAKKENRPTTSLLTELKAEKQKLDKEYNDLEAILMQDSKYNNRIKVESELKRISETFNHKYVEFIQSLAKVTPMEVGIQTIQTSENTVTLIAEGESQEYMDIFKKKIEDQKLFSNISVAQEGDKEKKMYKVVCIK